MSGRESVTLSPGGGAVRVEHGVADVFSLAAGSVQVPLSTLTRGAVVPAAAGTVTIRVVPRIGAVLKPLQDGPTAAEVEPFVTALAERIGGEEATALTAAAPAELPAALDTALVAYGERLESERAAQARTGAGYDEGSIREAYSRARRDIEEPGHTTRERADDALVAALEAVAAPIGFTVSLPPRSSVAAGAHAAHPAERLPAIAHASGVRYRRVRLGGGWESARTAPFLAFERDGAGGSRAVALLPAGRGYAIARPGDLDRPVPLTPELRAGLEDIAFEFYPPLPRDRPVRARDVARLALRGTRGLGAWAAATGLAIALLGLLTPVLTNYILGTAVPEGDRGILVDAAVGLGLAALLAGGFALVQYFALSRFVQLATQRVQPAFWDRVLSMPPAFFRDYTAGDLSVRVLAVDALQQVVNVQVVGAALAAIFALVYLVVMFSLSWILGLAGLLVVAVTIVIILRAIDRVQGLYAESIDAQLRGTSWIVQVLTGMGKVRLAEAERRMEARYLDLVRRQVVPLSRMTGVLGRVQAWLIFVYAGAPALFFAAIGFDWGGAGSISPATYVAFSTAYVSLFAAVAALTAVIVPVASARPIFDLLQPLMRSLPEAKTSRADPGRLSGTIELREVTFRYEPDAPLVLDRLSLTVEPGEMVALVGATGSGKTTTLRIILGFDEPEEGQVLFDGRDLRDLDLALVRSQMGAVLQNGQITRDSILKNILGGTAGDEAAAWEAAEAAALADDIRAMTMQMQTIVEPALLSGGQAQRVLLARALVRNPSIVLLDEATSALDNESQHTVTEALDQLGVTRIVIAHRLSTVRAADRIIVIDAGRIAEEGTYDELLAAGGAFSRLAERQTA
jgi:ATP-binding cassette subfamily C protein